MFRRRQRFSAVQLMQSSLDAAAERERAARALFHLAKRISTQTGQRWRGFLVVEGAAPQLPMIAKISVNAVISQMCSSHFHAGLGRADSARSRAASCAADSDTAQPDEGSSGWKLRPSVACMQV